MIPRVCSIGLSQEGSTPRFWFACEVKAVGINLLFDSPSIYGTNDDKFLATSLKRLQPKVVLAAQVLVRRGAGAGLSLLRASTH